MDATAYYEGGHMNYMWYTNKEVNRKARAEAVEHNSNWLDIYWANGKVEHLERRGTRWFH